RLISIIRPDNHPVTARRGEARHGRGEGDELRPVGLAALHLRAREMACLSSTAVRAVIEELARNGTAVARADGSEHELFPVAIPPEEGEVLRELVIRERARQTVEVGLGYGISTLFICDGLLAQDLAAA